MWTVSLYTVWLKTTRTTCTHILDRPGWYKVGMAKEISTHCQYACDEGMNPDTVLLNRYYPIHWSVIVILGAKRMMIADPQPQV